MYVLAVLAYRVHGRNFFFSEKLKAKSQFKVSNNNYGKPKKHSTRTYLRAKIIGMIRVRPCILHKYLVKYTQSHRERAGEERERERDINALCTVHTVSAHCATPLKCGYMAKYNM